MADDFDHDSGGGPSLAAASFSGLCPRCGANSLFNGPIKLASRCSGCGLDFDQFNVGDGPAAFLILIVGGLVASGAIWMELAFAPPWFAHLVWLPILIGLTLLGLRWGKAALLVQEYRTGAREGRIVP